MSTDGDYRRPSAAIDPTRAGDEAHAALALAAERQTTALLPAELWLQCGRALLAAGDTAQATEVVSRGRDWLRTTAAEQVPAPLRDSFLQRNPINRDLQGLTARLTLS